MPNSSPLVSVIMPAYNAEEFIEQAISSVIAQTVEDWELIVIDDCSQDRTRQIVEGFVHSDDRVRLVCNEKNMGAAGSRNRGLELCNGAYVALLDSDDYWYSQFLERLIACAETTKAGIIYCSYAMVDEEGKKVCNDFIVPEQIDFQQSMIRTVTSGSNVLLTKEIVKAHHFPLNMYHEDIALWFSLLRDGVIARGVSEVMLAYRQRGDSRSANKLKSACRRWAIYRKHLKLPFMQSVVLMIRYGYYGVIKYKRI